MTETEWVPFGLSEEEAAQYAVLLPGVSAQLREPLIGWLRPALVSEGWVRMEFCLQMQVALDLDIGVYQESFVQPDRMLNHLRTIPGLSLLRVVDYVLSKTSDYNSKTRTSSLEKTLAAARSKWTPGTRLGGPGLVERVPSGVQDSVEGVIRDAGTAGRVLSRAWQEVHGLEPKDSAAYADAVRSAEIAAVAKVEPRNSSATLGTVLGQMKADGDWRLPLREHSEAPGPETVLALIRTLWHGHRDRHGSVDYSDVTHEEARAAVLIAACIVDWLESGALARRPAEPGGAA